MPRQHLSAPRSLGGGRWHGLRRMQAHLPQRMKDERNGAERGQHLHPGNANAGKPADHDLIEHEAYLDGAEAQQGEGGFCGAGLERFFPCN
jgi:hypothetical protein